MKKYLLLPALLIASAICAQIPEDVLRYSFFPQNGTARNLAIGGAMGSLGGDINANFVNPAGLGNYKTGEFVFTPGFYFNNNNINFRDTKLKSSKSNFTLAGPIGIVYGATNRYKPGTSQAISLAVTQTANYNNTIQYSGYNNYSSYSEQFAEQAIQGLNKGTIEDVLNDPQYAYGAAPALYTYLVDTFSGNIGSRKLAFNPACRHVGGGNGPSVNGLALASRERGPPGAVGDQDEGIDPAARARGRQGPAGIDLGERGEPGRVRRVTHANEGIGFVGHGVERQAHRSGTERETIQPFEQAAEVALSNLTRTEGTHRAGLLPVPSATS